MASTLWHAFVSIGKSAGYTSVWLTIRNRQNSNQHSKGVSDLPLATHLCGERLGPRYDPLLSTVQIYQAVSAERYQVTRRRCHRINIFKKKLMVLRARRTDNRRQRGRSWMGCTSVFFAPAVQLHAHRTGGTVTSTLDPQSFFNLTAGLRIPATNGQPSERRPSITA